MLNFGTFNFENVLMLDYKADYKNGWYVIVAKEEEPTQYVGIRIEQEADPKAFKQMIDNKAHLNICGTIYKNPKTSRTIFTTASLDNITQA